MSLTESKTIVHFRNGIGNFVELTPALQALASMDPSGKIDICTDSVWFDSRRLPLLDIWNLLPFVGLATTIEKIKDKPYKTWFWTLWNSGASAIEFFKSKKFYEPPVWDMMNKHESDYYMEIIYKFYGYKGLKPPQCIISANGPDITATGKKIVLTNGGFGEFCVMKKYNKFAEVAKHLKAFFKDDITLIKVGHKNELDDVLDFDIDYVNKLTLPETARVIQQADLVITNDTGNMHVADAFGVPMIVLWGGTILAKNRPINAKAKIINLQLPCQPCQVDGGYHHCEEIHCLNDIQVGEIIYNIRQYFKRGVFDGD